MVNLFRSQKGLTLVEVLISMLIFGIVAFAFLNLFGSSFVNIYSMGTKDRAMTRASDVMETLYRQQNIAGGFDENDKGEISAILKDDFGASEVDKTLFNNETSFKGTYEIVFKEDFFEGIDGYNVTISVSYTSPSEESNVSLTSFFRKRD